jgi:hypothetical protein
MKDELIKINLAKLANDNGVKLSSKYFYAEGKLCYIEDEILTEIDVNGVSFSNWNCNGEFWFDENGYSYEPIKYYALTQNLLQKYFRDLHKIHIEINLANNNGDYYFEIEHIVKDAYNILHYDDGIFYNNYEQCLEQALTKCFKFI